MPNKKGAIAAEELFGALRWLFVLVVVLLVFYGCSVFELKKTSAQITVSASDLEAAKSLNYFLGFPVDGQNSILDLIQESYKSGNYDQFNKMQREYFSGKYGYWNLIISDQDNNIIYESKEFSSSAQLSEPINEVSESEENFVVIGKEGSQKTINILLQAFSPK